MKAMKRAHHLIYVPGIGDHKNRGEQQGLVMMRLFGITPHFHRMNWSRGQFGPKLEELIAEIDKYSAEGAEVSLMGFSAGASAALNAFAARPDVVASVVCVSGKILRPEIIRERIRAKNPAFIQSMAGLDTALPAFSPASRARILCTHPISDSTVAVEDAVFPGARERTMPVHGHAAAIVYALLIDARVIARFMKASGGDRN